MNVPGVAIVPLIVPESVVPLRICMTVHVMTDAGEHAAVAFAAVALSCWKLQLNESGKLLLAPG